MKFKTHKKGEGFTLVEVLISIAIFLIITTIVLVNYRQGENSSTFRLQAFDIEDLIRDVQGMSIAGKKIEDTIPVNGYGVFLDKIDDEIVVFGDMDSDNLFNEGVDLLYSRNFLSDNINFNKFNIFCDIYSNPNSLSLMFIPPKPLMIINNDSTCTSSVIYLDSDSADGIWIISFDAVTGRVWTDFSE